MGDLVRTVLGFATGTQWGFSISIWAGMSFVLLLMAGTLAAVAPRLLDPIAVEIARRPRRVALWIPMAVIGVLASTALFAASWIGIPIAVLLVLATPMVGGIGYLAAGLIVGDRAARLAGHDLEPWQAALLGVGIFRIVRLVPEIGATLHSLIFCVGLGAASAVLFDVCRSWHRRRMPDAEQFKGENLIEWYPPDPPDGAPPPPRP